MQTTKILHISLHSIYLHVCRFSSTLTIECSIVIRDKINIKLLLSHSTALILQSRTWHRTSAYIAGHNNIVATSTSSQRGGLPELFILQAARLSSTKRPRRWQVCFELSVRIREASGIPQVVPPIRMLATAAVPKARISATSVRVPVACIPGNAPPITVMLHMEPWLWGARRRPRLL